MLIMRKKGTEKCQICKHSPKYHCPEITTLDVLLHVLPVSMNIHVYTYIQIDVYSFTHDLMLLQLSGTLLSPSIKDLDLFPCQWVWVCIIFNGCIVVVSIHKP